MFSPDNSLIVYSRRGHLDTHESSLIDLYTYNMRTGDIRQLTDHLRAHSPAFSPGGKHVVFVVNGDGTENIWQQDIRADENGMTRSSQQGGVQTTMFDAGKPGVQQTTLPEEQFITRRAITHFKDGEQAYNPIYTADGKSIIFDYSLKDNR